MNHLEKERQQKVLTGPPGVLFGLTLLVFAVARVWFGWGPDFTRDTVDTKVAGFVVTAEPASADAAPRTVER